MTSILARLGRWAATIVLLVILVGLWPSRFGGSTTFVVVQGDSMLPAARNGDLVVSRSHQNYSVGDIIVYEIQPHGPASEPEQIIHRITEVLPDGSFATQGDNRSTEDAVRPTAADVVGKEQLTIPYGGYLIWLCSRWWVLALASGFLITLCLLRDPPTDKSTEPSMAPNTNRLTAPSIESVR